MSAGRGHATTTLLAALLFFAILAVSQGAGEEHPLPQDDDGAAFDDEYDNSGGSGDDGFFEASPHWLEMRARLQRSIDGDGLLRARRWGNIANGALLAATGPIALTVSLFGLKLSNVVLSLYVTAFGGVLAGIELGLAPIAPWVSTNLGYLTTPQGRTALLAFMGGLTWPLGKLGLVPGLLTCGNALFNANFAQLLAFVSADDNLKQSGEEAEQAAPAGFKAGDNVGDAEAEALSRAKAKAELQAALERAEAEAQAKEAAQAQAQAEAAAPQGNEQ